LIRKDFLVHHKLHSLLAGKDEPVEPTRISKIQIVNIYNFNPANLVIRLNPLLTGQVYG